MKNDGNFYESKDLDTLLAKIFTHIKEGRPAEADAIIDEFDLREWLCGSI